MNIQYKVAVLATGWLLALASTASAQMFGERSLGTPISQRLQPASTDPAAAAQSGTSGTPMGVVPTNARFSRQNRSADSFVGSGAQAASHFVGAEAAGGTVQPVVTDLSSQRAAASANRQLQAALTTPPPHISIYPPRLQVSFAYSGPSTGRLSSVLSERLRACPEFHASGSVEVLLAGRTAVVRGTVASERDRSLARQLILFEPGVSAVQNELTIQPPPLRQNPPSTMSRPVQTPRP